MNEKKMVGKRSVLFSRPPIIIGAGSVAGEKEGNGAFGKCFDMVEEDPLFGGKTWEEAESKMQQLATRIALRKAGLEPQEIRYLVAGDLLGQLIATSFGIMNFNIPMFGDGQWRSGFSIFTGKMETQRDRLCGSDGDYNRNDNRLWN